MKESLFFERLKSTRKEKGISQQELSRMLGVSRSAVSSWEIGNNEPEMKTLRKIAEVLNVSVAYLLGETEIKPIQKIPLEHLLKKEINVYECCGAGTGKTILGEPIGKMLAFEGDFAVKIRGDSMNPISSGSYVVIKKVYDVRDVRDGSLVVVRINGDEAVLKYWFIEDDYGVVLRSENYDYKPKFIPFEKFYSGECELIGIAVSEVRDLRGVNYKK